MPAQVTGDPRHSAALSSPLHLAVAGGGFGGSAIALLPASDADALADAVAAAFAERGYREPASFRVTPAAGAGRLT